jgi:hypothetical protein
MASDTLFTVSLAVARMLEISEAGVATGGDADTLIDTTQLIHSDNHWNKGTVWIVSADGAPPEGEWGVIKDFDNGTSAITITTALGASIADGDGYETALPLVPLSKIIASINRVLTSIQVPTIDDTSLEIVVNTTNYTLPDEIKRGSLIKVRYQTSTANAGTPGWKTISGWDIIPSAKGVADTLELHRQYTAGRALELTYLVRHPAVYARADTFDEWVVVYSLGVHAAVACIKSLMMRDHKNQYLSGLANSLLDEKDNAELTRYRVKQHIPTRKVTHRSNV